ncbi:MAG: ComEA family DNA-binding protein [Dehalococcoidia bacterium]
MDALDPYRAVIFVALASVFAAGAAFFVAERNDGPPPLEIVAAGSDAGQPIEVYVTGAVTNPGVYQLSGGARVVDALNQAGGQAPDADIEAINLAERLHDEDQVAVPRLGETSAITGTTGAASAGVVNINTATAAELDALPGIGEVYSARIVESRDAVGPFQTLEDLLTRDLVPRATFEKIYELITVGP